MASKIRPPGTITLAEGARLLMVKPRWVQQLATDGHIPKAERGYYPLVGVVQGYVKFLKEEQRTGSGSAAQNRVREARAAEIELRIAREERKLISLDDGMAVIDSILGPLRSDLDGLSAAYTRNLHDRRRLDDMLREVLTNAADRAEYTAEALRAGNSLDTALRIAQSKAGRSTTRQKRRPI